MKRVLAFCVFCWSIPVVAQTVTRPLLNSGSEGWGESLYLYGITETDGKADLTVYRYNFGLQALDSIKTPLGKHKAEEYLRCWSDTIHGYLNIYRQKKNEDAVDIVRLTKKQQLLPEIHGVQTGRLNNRGMLGASPFFYGGRVYTLRVSNSKEGRQFFLDCLELKDAQQNFDYRMKWQYAFERKNVSRAFIINAEKRWVNLFAAVDSGPKKGQWVLTVNASNGELIRGSRISPKGEKNEFLFGACFADTVKRLTHVIGQKTGSAPGTIRIWYVSVDSTGTIGDRLEFALPANEPKRGAAKTSPDLTLDFERLRPTPSGLSAEADIYIRHKPAGCFNYCNTVKVDIELGPDGPTTGKTTIRSNRLIEDWLYLQDKQLINGRFCPDSTEGRSVAHHLLPFPVKIKFKPDNGRDHLLLQKTETAKGQISFGFLGAEKGKQKIIPISSIRKNLFPRLHAAGDTTYLLVSDLPAGGVEIRRGSW